MPSKSSSEYTPYAKRRLTPASQKKAFQTTLCVRRTDIAFLQSLVSSNAPVSAAVDHVLTKLAGDPVPPIIIAGVVADDSVAPVEDAAEKAIEHLKRLLRDINSPLPAASGPYAVKKARERRVEMEVLRQDMAALSARISDLKANLLGGYAPPVAQLPDAAESWVADFNAEFGQLIEEANRKTQFADSDGIVVVGEIAKAGIIAEVLNNARLSKRGPATRNECRPSVEFPDIDPSAVRSVQEVRQLPVRIRYKHLRLLKRICRRYRLTGNSAAMRVAIEIVKGIGCTAFKLKTRVASVESLDRFLAVANAVYGALASIESRLEGGVMRSSDKELVQQCDAWRAFLDRHEPRIRNHTYEVRRVRHVLLAAAAVDTQRLVEAVNGWVNRAAAMRKKYRQENWRSDWRDRAEAERFLALSRIVNRDQILWRLFYAVGLTDISPEG